MKAKSSAAIAAHLGMAVRSGDQGEYLAQYMLSHLGASVLIPRQEDHGFDFHCTINSAATGQLPNFRDSFYVQAKVGAPKKVSVGGRTTGKRWREGRIHQFFNMDLPLCLAFVDIENHELIIYQTSARWLLYYETIAGAAPFEVTMSPSESISRPESRKARNITPTNKHDGKNWRIDLGKPLVTIRLRDLKHDDKIAAVKSTLSAYIALERRNSAHRIFRTQWAQWVCKIKWGTKPFKPAWVVEPDEFPRSEKGFYGEFGMALASLVWRLHKRGTQKARRQASDLFRMLEQRFDIGPNLRAEIEKALAANGR